MLLVINYNLKCNCICKSIHSETKMKEILINKHSVLRSNFKRKPDLLKFKSSKSLWVILKIASNWEMKKNQIIKIKKKS